MVFTILAILHELMQKPKVTACYIAQKYEISQRSVYRYINHLSASGFPITTTLGKNGGISLNKSFCLNNICYTKTQICFLLTLCTKCPYQNSQTKQLIFLLKQVLQKA